MGSEVPVRCTSFWWSATHTHGSLTWGRLIRGREGLFSLDVAGEGVVTIASGAFDGGLPIEVDFSAGGGVVVVL